MAKWGKIYRGQPLPIKSRQELLATIRQPHRKYLRPDNGDLPECHPAGPELTFCRAVCRDLPFGRTGPFHQPRRGVRFWV